MSGALTPLFAVAAIVLCLSGVAKLRSPGAAAAAVGLTASAIRVLAVGELGLGIWSLVAPGRLNAALVAAVYVGFSGVSLVLARRRTPCGCFGERDEPTSVVQSILSALLAVAAALAAIWPTHDVAWMAARSPVLVIGIAGAAYAAVATYTLLPAAWSAWEGSR